MKVYIRDARADVISPLAFYAEEGGFEPEVIESAQDLCSALYRDPQSIGVMFLSPLIAANVLLAYRQADVRSPIFVLSEEPTHNEIAGVLICGADDVQPWPIDKTEFVARLAALARRDRGPDEGWIALPNDCRFHVERGVVESPRGNVMLTRQEATMFASLVRRPETVMSKEAIYGCIYPNANDRVQKKIIDVFICKVRRKLYHALGDIDVIETAWGRGYRFIPAGFEPKLNIERVRAVG